MMTRDRNVTLVAWVQRALVALGIALLAWVGYVWAGSAWYRHQQQRAIDDAASRPAPASDASSEPFDRSRFSGLLEIPRIGMSEAFAEGDDDATLDKAIGHLADTPLPWETGNTAFAGHRDQHFRPLKNVRAGDDIRLVTPRGTFDYLVSETFIVTPEDLWVLAPTNGRELTLITCYPFNFIGHAPKRFVVKARSTSVSDPSGTTSTRGTSGPRNDLTLANVLR
jgi:sortase A